MNKSLIVINMFGGPNTYKSTHASMLFAELNSQHEVTCELIPEFAKQLTWSGNMGDLSNQDFVHASQNNLLQRVVGKVEVAVTDTSLLLGLVYGKNLPQQQIDWILHNYHSYNNINILLKRDPDCLYFSQGRNQTKQEAERVDADIEHMLMMYGIEHTIMYSHQMSENIINIINQINNVVSASKFI